jgi:hypothetical protein
MAISSSFFGPENVVTLSIFFSQKSFVWVIPNFLSQSGRKIHPKKKKKKKKKKNRIFLFSFIGLKKPLSNEPTNTPLWMNVAWNGCKSEVNFIHWPQKWENRGGAYSWVARHPGHTSITYMHIKLQDYLLFLYGFKNVPYIQMEKFENHILIIKVWKKKMLSL